MSIAVLEKSQRIQPVITYTMSEPLNVRRGDVWLADMSYSLGSEQSGIRYVCVISNDIGNRHSPAITVCSITSQNKAKLPTHVEIPAGDGFMRSSTIMTEQLRSIDKFRLISHITRLNSDYMSKVDQALKISVGLFQY